jgi:hypothetical protein
MLFVPPWRFFFTRNTYKVKAVGGSDRLCGRRITESGIAESRRLVAES